MSLRPDGRSENTLRALACEFGTLKNCNGSAIWKSGETTVLAAVHGPVAPRQSQYESLSGCIISLVIKSGSGSSYDTEWESFLTQQLSACIVRESYPRSVISIILQIVNDDGSVLSAALHAGVSALLDATIEMNYLPTAVTFFSGNNTTKSGNGNDTIMLDPTVNEEHSAQAVLVLIFLPTNDSLIGCFTTASMRQSPKQFIRSCKVASLAVPAIQAFWRLAIEKVTQLSYQLQVS